MARRKQQAATEAVRQSKLNITLRTVKNGYLLDVEGEGYMYFNEQSLIEGFCIHLGLERKDFMTRDEIRSLLRATEDGSAEKRLQEEVTQLKEELKNVKAELRGLKKSSRES